MLKNKYKNHVWPNIILKYDIKMCLHFVKSQKRFHTLVKIKVNDHKYARRRHECYNWNGENNFICIFFGGGGVKKKIKVSSQIIQI